jgi:hypothetical protein
MSYLPLLTDNYNSIVLFRVIYVQLNFILFYN